MSQDLRNEHSGERDNSRPATGGDDRKNYESFEGMNYEQVRKPFNARYKARNSATDDRNNSTRPDES